MTAINPGWYPNPDGSTNQRYWDGENWTSEIRDFAPPSSTPGNESELPAQAQAPQTDYFRGVKKRPVWLKVLGLIAIVLLFFIFLRSCSSTQVNDQKSAQLEVVQPEAQLPVEEVPAEPETPAVVPLGSPIVSPNYSLVIDSVEVLDQIDTNYGGPILADPGTKLVLVHSTISITGNAIDLSCGSAGAIFIQAYDSNKSEMAHIFEGQRIPGNPECNFKTSAGQTVSWNFAFKMGADRTPAILSVIDTNVDGNWGEAVFASLQ